MTPQEVQDAYNSGSNITELLRLNQNQLGNSEDVIEISYDLQAGSYVEAVRGDSIFKHKQEYAAEIADSIEEGRDGGVPSLLEVGVGEATTLSFVLEALKDQPAHIHGFDISWSRIAVARNWLEERKLHGVRLFVASLFHLPYEDASFDTVYTSHSIEPNRGREVEILSELLRVTAKKLILLEPGYELADEEARSRMDKFGYCRGLVKTVEELGGVVERHELISSANPKNPTAMTVVLKQGSECQPSPQWSCPKYGKVLRDLGDVFYSQDNMQVYPVIRGIPCLRQSDGFIASAFEQTL